MSSAGSSAILLPIGMIAKIVGGNVTSGVRTAPSALPYPGSDSAESEPAPTAVTLAYPPEMPSAGLQARCAAAAELLLRALRGRLVTVDTPNSAEYAFTGATLSVLA